MKARSAAAALGMEQGSSTARSHAIRGGGTVAVVVPVHREGLSPEEQISLRHLNHYLGGFDKYAVTPAGSPAAVTPAGLANKSFAEDYFRNTATYSALLLSREFYQAFAAYEFILIYQLDALVFSNQLLDWCAKGYDYVGAPWLKCEEAPHVAAPAVGNGGFSLRRVGSFLKVLDSPGCVEPEIYRLMYCGGVSKFRRRLRVLRNYRRWRKALGGTRWRAWRGEPHTLFKYGPNEDLFWSFDAAKYWPGFKVAPPEEGLRFAFELLPRQCFAMNDRVLPFGCHAWAKYDREFWEPHLLK